MGPPYLPLRQGAQVSCWQAKRLITLGPVLLEVFSQGGDFPSPTLDSWIGHHGSLSAAFTHCRQFLRFECVALLNGQTPTYHQR
jgi:hypothetical protein